MDDRHLGVFLKLSIATITPSGTLFAIFRIATSKMTPDDVFGNFFGWTFAGLLTGLCVGFLLWGLGCCLTPLVRKIKQTAANRQYAKASTQKTSRPDIEQLSQLLDEARDQISLAVLGDLKKIHQADITLSRAQMYVLEKFS